MDHITTPTQAAQTIVQQQMPQPPLSQLSQPFQPVAMPQQAPPSSHPQPLREVLPKQPQQQPYGLQGQLHLATHISPHILPQISSHVSPQVQQQFQPVSHDNAQLHQLYQPVQQPAVEGQLAPDMAHGAPSIQHPAQALPPQRQGMEPALTDLRGSLEHPYPGQASRQERAKEEYWRLNLALERCLPESLQCAVRLNWERCLNGTVAHQIFLVRSISNAVSCVDSRIAQKKTDFSCSF